MSQKELKRIEEGENMFIHESSLLAKQFTTRQPAASSLTFNTAAHMLPHKVPYQVSWVQQ